MSKYENTTRIKPRMILIRRFKSILYKKSKDISQAKRITIKLKTQVEAKINKGIIPQLPPSKPIMNIPVSVTDKYI